MNIKTLGRVAGRSVTAGLQHGSRTRQQLRCCLRSISTTTVPHHGLNDTRRKVSQTRCFTSSSTLHKKGGKAAREESAPSGSAKTENPRDFTALEADISQILEKLKAGLGKLRSGGRFNPEVLERLRVVVDKANGTKAALSDVAQVISKGRNVQIIAGEKEYLKPVTSAIQGSDLSLSPVPDPTGKNPLLLEIKIPPPTAESRKMAVKEAVKAGENAGSDIQNARAQQNKKLQAMKSNKAVRPDDLFKASAEMEKVVEKGQKEVKTIIAQVTKMLESA